MHQTIKGMIMGSAVTLAAVGGYAFGTSQEQSDAPYRIDELERANCDVDVGFGRMTAGSQCRFDQVMVGVRDDYLLCADVTVTCPNR